MIALFSSATLLAVWCVVQVDAAIAANPDAPAGQRADAQPALRWKQCLSQTQAWYASTEAARIAANVLLYQRASGGWPKNIELTEPLNDAAKDRIRGDRIKQDSMIDNGATTRELRYLARVHTVVPAAQFKTAFLSGLDYLLEGQYPNGGWPQAFPNPKGYASHITFNDNAMVDVLTLLRDIASQESAEFTFVDDPRRSRAKSALDRGIACLLDCQVLVKGRRTVWCAQHDALTLAPAPARSYEKVSLSGSESVGIVRFLMAIENPSPRVIEAVESAVAWFRVSALKGIRQIEKPDPTLPKGFDKVIVEDAQAPPLWARFHEIGSNHPIFCGRDGVVKYALAEIESERRNGYSWYTAQPGILLSTDYPAWRKRNQKSQTALPR